MPASTSTFVMLYRISLLIVSSLVLVGCVVMQVADSGSAKPFESPMEKLRRSAAGLRTLGVAVESYAIDHNFYPDTGCTDAIGTRVRFCPASSIAPYLMPVYARGVSFYDGWGRPLLYAGLRHTQAYALIGTGSDGVVLDIASLEALVLTASSSAVPLQPIQTRCIQDELVLVQGQFIQYPSDSVSDCSGGQSF